MRRLGWISLNMASNREFKVRHGLAWGVYVGLLTWNLELLWEVRRAGALFLLPSVLLAWVTVFTALVNIEPWLDGANRFLTFRVALVLSSLLSCSLGIWMLGHYGLFFLVAPVIVLKRSAELFSLTAMTGGFVSLFLNLVTYAVFTWISLRVVIVLVFSTRKSTFEEVLGDPPHTELPLPPSVRAGGERLVSTREAASAPVTAALREPWGEPGKRRYLVRPRELEPERDATYGYVGPPVLNGLSFRGGLDPEKFEKCRDLGWMAFEWILRTEPSLQELHAALEALPCLARVVDEPDALEARDWISRLADHPGEYERPLHAMEIVDHIRSLTVRIADVALLALMDWDQERARHGQPGVWATSTDERNSFGSRP